MTKSKRRRVDIEKRIQSFRDYGVDILIRNNILWNYYYNPTTQKILFCDNVKTRQLNIDELSELARDEIMEKIEFIKSKL